MTVISFDQDGKELKHVLFIYIVATNSSNSYQDYAIELKTSNVFSILITQSISAYSVNVY